MKYLITGGCGFLGSNLLYKLKEQGEEVLVFDNLSRIGSEKSKGCPGVRFIHGDIRNREDVERVILSEKPQVIFHLAGQVAMTTSLRNPRLDFETNVCGTFNLLDAIRKYSPESIVIYSSTNKVYGDLEWIHYDEIDSRYISKQYPSGFSEELPLNFTTPYGASKGAADQYMLDYYKMFNIRSIVFRHSSMYGPRQYATYDQGWVGWFCKQALSIKENKLDEIITFSGNGKQVRDLLYVDDVVDLYLTSVRHIDKMQGQAFNIGGGMKNSLSLLELFTILEEELDISIKYKKLPSRPSDQLIFVANMQKIFKCIEWTPKVNKLEGVRRALKWGEENVY